MAAKDIFHETVRKALETDGWTITDDPLLLPLGERKLYVDLGAEKLLTANKEDQYIAVEVKSFVGNSIMSELEKAVGQYTLYRQSLRIQQSNRQLYLAIPTDAYVELSTDKLISIIQEDLGMKLLVYNPTTKLIELWLP
ncbi:XisH family protein [Spirosoma soli]|uniref:XisH family protein n=1 Tax=Spirosoma soli TaxID=1770529 RepID=A0ABW5MBY9_9BACT